MLFHGCDSDASALPESDMPNGGIRTGCCTSTLRCAVVIHRRRCISQAHEDSDGEDYTNTSPQPAGSRRPARKPEVRLGVVRSQEQDDAPPSVRRPVASDALATALWLFQHGERVDMNTVASHLGIGRTTLYRWVGDREKLLGRVLLASIGNLWQRSLADAEGEGLERPLDATRRFIEGCIENEPVTSFTQRESNLALRVLLDPDGVITHVLKRDLLAATSSAAPEIEAPEETFGVLALTATALVWANVAGGRHPDIDATIGIMRTVLTAHARPDRTALDPKKQGRDTSQ